MKLKLAALKSFKNKIKGEKYYKVYGRFGTEFKEYREENIGIWDLEENYER